MRYQDFLKGGCLLKAWLLTINPDSELQGGGPTYQCQHLISSANSPMIIRVSSG